MSHGEEFLYMSADHMPPAPSPALVDFCNRNAQTLLAMLCDTAGTIAHHCGFQALLTLVSERGGTSMYIPARRHDAHSSRLAEIVGAEHARTLIGLYGGTYVAVPTSKGTLSRVNRLRALHLSAAGWPCAKIAKELGVSTRAVNQMKAAAHWKHSAGQIRAARESS